VSLSHLAVAFIVGCFAAGGYLSIGHEQAATVGSTSFSMCGRTPHHDCVIDGDTFYLGSEKIRVADIDAPETHPSRCAKEARLGHEATDRLLKLLNAGPFTLEHYGSRDRDRYGRLLRVVVRGGQSLGGMLVSEGLARQWTGHRRPWCT
jgi:micrococcal nuclease